MNLERIPKSVRIMEVGPRDGLQNESTFVDTKHKVELVEDLVACGVKRIEVTAFVSSKWIPPLADHMEVAAGIRRESGVSYAALVPNMKGYERARAHKMDEISFVLAASNSHNLKNIHASTDEAFARYAEVAIQAKKDAIPFRAYISCAFGCPYEGEIPLSEVIRLSKAFHDLGAYEIAVSDTIGVANPVQTVNLIQAIAREIPMENIALHLHDTRGMALANIFAALTLGVASFDCSVAGLGGCPYAPGAAGNVASEDLIGMLHAMHIETGINLNSLCDTSLKIEKLLGRHLPSKLLAVRRCACE